MATRRANRIHKAAGRARIHRISGDLARTGDRKRARGALALARDESPQPSLMLTNWEVVIGAVERYRRIYRHLGQPSIDRWYKADRKLRIEDQVLINGKPVSLGEVVKACKIVLAKNPDERGAQLAFLAGAIRGDVWVQRFEE